MFSASVADLTRIKRSGRVLGDSCPAVEFSKRRIAPSIPANRVPTGLVTFIASPQPPKCRHWGKTIDIVSPVVRGGRTRVMLYLVTRRKLLALSAGALGTVGLDTRAQNLGMGSRG